MAIFKHDFSVGIQDIDAKQELSNTAILKYFEEIGCMHSDEVGFGLLQMEQTHLSWVVLQWKIEVLHRPRYHDTLHIETWARTGSKISTYRDFAVYLGDKLVIKGSSKWALIDIEKGSIAKITDELIAKYSPENTTIFDTWELEKLKEPENCSSSSFCFPVLRKDIDVNLHMHNLYYLQYAYEALPEDVFQIHHLGNFNHVEIMYKKGALLHNTVNCYYTIVDNKHVVIMKNATNNSTLHAILQFSS